MMASSKTEEPMTKLTLHNFVSSLAKLRMESRALAMWYMQIGYRIVSSGLQSFISSESFSFSSNSA